MMGSTLRPPPEAKRTSVALEDLRVPLALAIGKYEHIPTQELVDHLEDIKHELTRRNERPGE